MAIEVKVPQSGESVHEVQIAQWLKKEGQWVEKDEDLVEIDTEKATLQIAAPVAGQVSRILKREGEIAQVGEIIAELEENGRRDTSKRAPEAESKKASKAAQSGAAAPGAKTAAPTKPAAKEKREETQRVMPAARQLLTEHHLSPGEVEATGPGGRLLKEDVLRHVEKQGDGREAAEPAAPPAGPPAAAAAGGLREEEVVPMSMIRRKIAARLVQAQQEAALLTTFNEVDMGNVMELRKRFKDTFQQQYGAKLGFMSFFVKATIESLKRYPALNAEVREHSIVYRNYFDVGIAVGGGKGLVVPILRNAERMSFADIEKSIHDFAVRAQENRLKPEELEGGTFTISNGGIYGSLLSTPIVNPPQSGILGLHAIQDRPVARDGQVVIRPMMYLALTYDHRIVDGREAVSCLRHIKEVIEEPSRILIEV